MQKRTQNHSTPGGEARACIYPPTLEREACSEDSVPACLPCPPVRESGLAVLDKSPPDTDTSSAGGSLPNTTESPKGMVTASANLLLPLPQATQWMTAAPAPTPTASSNLPLLLFGGPCPIPSHSLPTVGTICHAVLASQHEHLLVGGEASPSVSLGEG